MRDFADLHAESWLLRFTARAGLALLFAGVFAFLSPFGTYRFGLVERIGYWTVQMAAWLVLSQMAAALVARRPSLRSATGQIATTALATLPMMLVTGSANQLMTGWHADVSELVELALSIVLIGGAHVVLGDWLVVQLGVGARQNAAEHPSGPDLDPSSSLAADPYPANGALVDRLPPYLRNEILCMQVEDHYVRVHGREGSAMVLMRFSDALRSVHHIRGSRVHRSWWVADDAVIGLRRSGRTAQLTMRNGTTVPVSQPYMAHALRSWGSLDQGAG